MRDQGATDGNQGKDSLGHHGTGGKQGTQDQRPAEGSFGSQYIMVDGGDDQPGEKRVRRGHRCWR